MIRQIFRKALGLFQRKDRTRPAINVKSPHVANYVAMFQRGNNQITGDPKMPRRKWRKRKARSRMARASRRRNRAP